MSEPTASSTNLVRGVDLAQVNLTVLNSALKDAGIKVTSKTSLEERVILLADFELKQCEGDAALPEEERKGGECTVCFGVSLLSRPCCPFCGTSDEQPAANSPVAAPSPKSAKAAKSKPAKAEPAAAAPVAKAKGKPAKDAPAPKAEKPAAPAKAAIVKVDAGKITKAKVAELDQAEKRVAGLLADGFVSQWKLGRVIAEVYKDGLWKYRLGEDGKPTHTFSSWCEAQNVSIQYARGLMNVATAFTEKQLREVGTTKLAIVLRVPPEARAELLEKAAKVSRNELEEEVQRIAPGASRQSIASGSDTARPGLAASNAERAAARPTRAVKKDEVTVAIALKRYELPLFARAKNADTDEPIRAKNLASDPHGALDLQNGVRLYFKLVEDEDGLSLVVECKRSEADAAE